jgi:hypothetical protein
VASSQPTGLMQRAPLPSPPTTLEDVAQRIARLANEQTRLLARATGDHLPVELAERVAALEQERSGWELLLARP